MNRVKPMACYAPKVLQLHPTRRCNLRCLHCYSSSAPTENSALDATLLLGAIADASAHGYNTVSISGGEPLLYPGLSSLLREA
jgi:Fe-coproporphyrin III synthase